MYCDLRLFKDASDNRKFIKTKDEDFIVESLGGAISGMFLGSNILLSQNISINSSMR